MGVISYKGDDEVIVYICGGLLIVCLGLMVMMRWCISMSRIFRLCCYLCGDYMCRNLFIRIVLFEMYFK